MICADEFGVPITLSPNKKNDVLYVDKGQQAVTNIFSHTKGDDTNAFSCFIAATKHGFLTTRMYTDKFDVPMFHKILRKNVAPALDDFKHEFSVFVHDHVTNSSDLYDEKTMDNVFGNGKWLQHCPKICREFRGKMSHVKATDKRCAYIRKVNEPKLVCECESKEVCYPSSSPEMNVAENIISEIKRRLWIACRDKKQTWKGSVKNKMKVLQSVMHELDEDKEYFERLFVSIPKRYRWIGSHNGDIYDG